MAAEVQFKRYFFKTTQTADDAAVASARASIDRSDPFSDQQTASKPPFLHNFYHDAESLWWIGVHSLFTTEPSGVERDQDSRQKQRGHFNTLFPHYAEGSGVRLDFLGEPVAADIIRCLPGEFRPVARVLDIIRNLLVAAYISAEAQKDFPQYDHFAKLFEKASLFEQALDKAVVLAVNDIRPFQQEDRSIHEDAEDKLEWALDRLKEENYADYDPPEDDADSPSEYLPSKGSGTKKPIAEVDQAETLNEEPAPKRPRRSIRIETLRKVQ